ncbi:MAG: dihydrodipicolinate synthase family protein [Enterococcaceae bacterium]|jgi:4-hydroxy-tetrahydrodipicolinate synthase|nr:dihydrodipicolinate synthase family protein [Enterococcaceae bacterium]
MKKYISPLLTLFKAEGQIDFEGMHKLYDYVIDGGISGIVLLGSSGEFYALDDQTAEALVMDALEYIGNRTEVYVGVNRMHDQQTIDFANEVLEKGANGVLLVGPYYINCNDDGLYQFFSKMAEQIFGDIYLYNYPDRTGYDLSPDLIVALTDEYPNIIGIKDTVLESAHTVSLLQTILPLVPDFKVFTGYDCNALETIKAGGEGAIGAISNIAPELCASLVRNVNQQQWEAAEESQSKIEQLMELYSVTAPFMPTFKCILKQKGIASSLFTCLPAAPITEKDAAKALNLYNQYIESKQWG